MGANENNGLFPRPHFSTWRYVTLLSQIAICRSATKYKLRPAMPPIVLPIVFTSMAAAALPFAMV
jgi:hypothetical protein